MSVLAHLARTLIADRHPPDFIIGGAHDPYLRRWWVIPRNRWFNVYLHHFMRSDDDRALHDHPCRPRPVWPLFITGPRVREWGFLCPRGWRHWRDFTGVRDGANDGRPGLGCD